VKQSEQGQNIKQLGTAKQDLASAESQNNQILSDRAKTRAIAKNVDGSYTDQQLDSIASGKGKEADALRSDVNKKAEQQFANLRAIDPTISEETAKEFIGNPEGEVAKAWLERINKANDKKRPSQLQTQQAQRDDSVGLGYFTGGLAPADIPVTVNERGQEAITNLQTLETSLLPNGERTVEFDAPTWVHNASETKQLGSLGVFDSGQLPNINFGAISGVLRINNTELLAELKLQNTLLSQLSDRITKPNVINNFSNDPRPDLTAYRVASQLLRV
jgi:hypothetical protein